MPDSYVQSLKGRLCVSSVPDSQSQQRHKGEFNAVLTLQVTYLMGAEQNM